MKCQKMDGEFLWAAGLRDGRGFSAAQWVGGFYTNLEKLISTRQAQGLRKISPSPGATENRRSWVPVLARLSIVPNSMF